MSARRFWISRKIYMNQLDNAPDVKVLFAISRGLIVLSLLVAIIVSTLVLANYYQIQRADVLNSPSLDLLRVELKERAQDTILREDVRSFHLLARKAYFNSLWQVKTGGYLILGSLIIFVLSLKVFNSVRRKLPDPNRYRITPDFLSFSHSVQTTILTAGGILFTSGLLVSILSFTQIPDPDNALSGLDDSIDLSQHWPAFRGPGGNGIAAHTDIPTDWDGPSGRNILWKTPIPRPGYSSPLVIKDQLFLSGGGASTREVYCFSTKNGELLWQQTVPNMLPPDAEFDYEFVDPGTGFAAPTMATDGKRVMAIFATGDLVCYTVSGDRAWGRNLGLLDNHYAHSSSLIVHENLCLVQYDSFENPRLIAIDISNGAIVWEVSRRTISWSSPILVHTGERMELILADSKSLSSYNPETGEQYWSNDCLSGEVGPSPAYTNGMVFCANEYAQGSGLQINGPGTDPPVEIMWQTTDYLPNTASPVAQGDYLIMATSGGMVSMLNTQSGEVYWQEYLGSGFYSSPIIVGNQVYLMDLEGKMFIFELSSSYELVNTCELGEPSSCTPAFMSGRIYIRSDKFLYCIGE